MPKQAAEEEDQKLLNWMLKWYEGKHLPDLLAQREKLLQTLLE